MRDPYQVLGVPSTATDEEIKKAYRNLARKYHPDNYHDNPLADLAQERMKEINEAYEAVQAQRKRESNGGSAGYGAGTYGGYSYANQGYQQSSGGSAKYQRVRVAINQGDLNLAEEILNAMTEHDAEWFYMKGALCYKRGWMDECKRYFETASQMDPGNEEYRQAYDMACGRTTTYRPSGFGEMTTGNCESSTCMRICAAYICCNLFGGGGFYFCC